MGAFLDSVPKDDFRQGRDAEGYFSSERCWRVVEDLVEEAQQQDLDVVFGLSLAIGDVREWARVFQGFRTKPFLEV